MLGSAKTNLLPLLWPAEWKKPAPFRSVGPFYDTFLAAIHEKISKTANENIWNFRILHQLIMYDPSTYTNVLRNFVSFHSLLLLHLIQAQLDPFSLIWNIWMRKKWWKNWNFNLKYETAPIVQLVRPIKSSPKSAEFATKIEKGNPLSCSLC